MEDIEEEMSSQCERSAQRMKSHQQDLDEIVNSSRIVETSKAARLAGELQQQKQRGGDTIESSYNFRAKNDEVANALMQDIEESLTSHESKTRASTRARDAITSHNYALVKQSSGDDLGPRSTPFGKVEPREAYQKVREKMLELEIERDEQQKALELLKEVRERERAELNRQIMATREDGANYADQVKNEMALRIEKQVQMIEALLDDKKQLQESMEKMQDKMKEMQQSSEKQRKVLEDRLQVELKKNKDAWIASEKVRKERWEKEKVQEIRAQTVKGLEPEI